MRPAVLILGIHLPGQRIVLVSGPADALEKADVPSPLERYFGRLKDSSFDLLIYSEDHSRYSVDDHPISTSDIRDVCETVRFANPRKSPVLCIVNDAHPKNHERFALRLFLRRFAARTWKELRTYDGEVYQTFYEAARKRGLVSNPDQEAQIFRQDAIDLQRPPSDVRFLLAQMVNYGARRQPLEDQFFAQLADQGDTVQHVHHKIDLLLHPDR
jgi:hypothetical protein